MIGANGYKFSSLDTILTLYTGITAEELAKQYHKQLDTIKDTIIINKLFFQESQKKKEAIGYYKKLVDANVTDEKFFDAYRVLAEYYEAQKDKVAFLDILNKGKKYFPKNDEYWIALEIIEATAVQNIDWVKGVF